MESGSYLNEIRSGHHLLPYFNLNTKTDIDFGYEYKMNISL
jgi:hypothetical protein